MRSDHRLLGRTKGALHGRTLCWIGFLENMVAMRFTTELGIVCQNAICHGQIYYNMKKRPREKRSSFLEYLGSWDFWIWYTNLATKLSRIALAQNFSTGVTKLCFNRCCLPVTPLIVKEGLWQEQKWHRTLWVTSGAAATSISMLCWPEARGNTMVHTRSVLALALLLCLIIYLGYMLSSYKMFTMHVRVLSIHTKPRECCYFQILSGECCETELFPTSDASRAQYPKHCSCRCTWMTSLDIFIYPSPQAGQWRTVSHTFIYLKRFNVKTQLHNILMFMCFKIYWKFEKEKNAV